MIKAYLILSQTRLIFSRLTDFSSVLTEFNSIWSDFWSDSDPNPIQTRPAPRPGYIRNKTLNFHFTPNRPRKSLALSPAISGDLFFLSRSLYFLRPSSSDAGQLRRTHFSSDFRRGPEVTTLLTVNQPPSPCRHHTYAVIAHSLRCQEAAADTPFSASALRRILFPGRLQEKCVRRSCPASEEEGRRKYSERERKNRSPEESPEIAGERAKLFRGRFGVKWKFRVLFLIYPGHGADRVWIGFGSESDQKSDQIKLNSVKTDEKSVDLLKIRRV
ncbi:hypothetical protein LXL04_000717 [Taraxacum kok-saghyz]